MKTGFTCPAGFNVVATDTHWGRHLITVVLGSPSARLRTEEAANLFDRGFAISSGLGPVESLASTGDNAPNPRGNVCLHRSAAVAAAAEEEEGSGETTQMASGGRGVASSSVVAGSAPVHTEFSWQAPRFDPVPVFVGPKPGWTGPVLAARAEEPATSPLPASLKAYAPDKTDVAAGASSNNDATAPTALSNAVRTPPANALRRRPHQHPHHQKQFANTPPQKPLSDAKQPAAAEKTSEKQTESAQTAAKEKKTDGDSTANKGNKAGD